MLKSKLLGATAAAEDIDISDYFSTYLYAGNGSTQTITNGIDLAGEGGLVWIKSRTVARSHNLFDSERIGTSYKVLSSDTTGAEADPGNRVTAFNADGFTMSSSTGVNGSAESYASWTFRKAPRWFDVVTWSGDGVSSRQISHNLGVTPGCIVVKTTNVAGTWETYHRGLNNGVDPEDYKIALNTTSAQVGVTGAWANTAPTDSVFYVNGTANTNDSGKSYVAYLFAHDPLGPSGDGSDGLIACGSYTGNASTDGPEINLGWEPQWLLIKNATTGGYSWMMLDNMRGIVSGGDEKFFRAETANAEGTFGLLRVTSTGFKLDTTDGSTNRGGDTFIYIAIRRGPMREPTSGTEVFAPVAYTGNAVDDRVITTGFPVDYLFATTRALLSNDGNVFDRMRGAKQRLVTQSTAAESTMSANYYVDGLDNNTGFILGGSGGLNSNGTTFISYAFRRAPGFFDVVAYTGNGVAGRTVPHNLGVAPEMMIMKRRNGIAPWSVFAPNSIGNTQALLLNSNIAKVTYDGINNTNPTNTVFTLGNDSDVNASGGTFIAYLFATLPGISKVGSYTGNGSNQTINCGFTGGARFVLIKRTDSAGDWYVWDTARGIVAGNDPHLSLNTTAAEVTTNDSIDPDSSGFIVNQVAATNINVSSASYIYFAVS